MQAPTEPQIELEEVSDWSRVIMQSPWVWGGLLTLGFYTAIPHITVWQAELQRYCCMHWVEYLEVGLFFVGLVVLVQKALTLRHEFAAFRTSSLRALSPDTTEARQQLHAESELLPDSQLDTVWARRLRGISRFLRERKTASGLKDQLSYLSNTAADALHDSHSLLQTIIWAIPIMGFLGTVLGITLAIANVTPEQLDTSLPEVTGGLAVAFDTTAIALVFSLGLVFGSLFVKRSEDSIISMAEETALSLCGPLLDAPSDSGTAIAQAESESARRLLESTGGLIEKQTGLWQESLDTLRERWSQTISAHEEVLGESLRRGTTESLNAHLTQLETLRQEFLTACQLVSQHVSASVEKIEQDRRTYDAAQQQQLENWTTMLREDINAAGRTQQRQLRHMLDEFADRLDRWTGSFTQLATASEQNAAALTQHSEQLLKIVAHEEQLVGLHSQLNRNLDSLRATEQFEESIHSLNAAIHLLTAKAHSRAA